MIFTVQAGSSSKPSRADIGLGAENLGSVLLLYYQRDLGMGRGVQGRLRK